VDGICDQSNALSGSMKDREFLLKVCDDDVLLKLQTFWMLCTVLFN
jgi:hypothetical protein